MAARMSTKCLTCFMDLLEGDDDMGDPTAASSAMEAALVAAGTHKDAAQLFVNKIIGNDGVTVVMEMYGQGTIVFEANRTRRSLDCEGLRAFDLFVRKSPMVALGISKNAKTASWCAT